MIDMIFDLVDLKKNGESVASLHGVADGKKEWEIINSFTVEESTPIVLTVDKDGNPYNLKNIIVYCLYPANSKTQDSGYGRIRFHSGSYYLNCERSKYTTATVDKFSTTFVERNANLTKCTYTYPTNVGNSNIPLYVKRTTSPTSPTGGGYAFSFGAIDKIEWIDPEPVGTVVTIYAEKY